MYTNTGNVSSHLTSSGGAAATPRNPTTTYPLLHHHQLHHPIMIPLPPPALPPGGGEDDDFPRRDERFPQWSNQETRDFIEIRAQLEWDFITVKRNKNLWEMVANRMRDKGYRRTADQCKCKWKNLVNRYKVQEASDADNLRQCPFFNELHAVFTVRANRMQQTQVEAEAGIIKGTRRLRKVSEDQSLEEFTEEWEEDEEKDIELVPIRKTSKEKRQKIVENEHYLTPKVNKNDGVINVVREMMKNFIAQQQRIDMQWRETMERNAKEREMFEEEWRQKMEKLERERLMMEQAWREREEQRRLREESRAERRDELLTALLNRLVDDESP